MIALVVRGHSQPIIAFRAADLPVAPRIERHRVRSLPRFSAHPLAKGLLGEGEGVGVGFRLNRVRFVPLGLRLVVIGLLWM